MSSGVEASARSTISRTAGSPAAISSRSASRERVHVEEERLLDLGRVEEAPAALGRELGVIGQHDRGAEDDGVVGSREHGPRVDVVAQPGLERGDERAAADAQQRVGRDQGVLERLGAGAARERRPVLDRQRHAVEAGLHRRDLQRGLAPQRRQVDPADADPPLDRLVSIAARLQEAHLDVDPGILAADEALQPEVIEPVLVAGRIDDPEGRRRRVLVRSRRVGVERVALEEQGVDQLLDHSAPPSSSVTAASKVGRPRSAFRSCSRRSVSACTRIQPLPG